MITTVNDIGNGQGRRLRLDGFVPRHDATALPSLRGRSPKQSREERILDCFNPDGFRNDGMEFRYDDTALIISR